jgi:hypothetical protein
MSISSKPTWAYKLWLGLQSAPFLILILVLVGCGIVSTTTPKPNPTTDILNPPKASTEQIERNVFLLVYDPILSNGQKLTEYKGWYSYLDLTQEFSEFLRRVSGGRLNYTVVYTVEINDSVWLEKTDGFRYSEESYLTVIEKGLPQHEPDIADYGQFLDDDEFGICGSFNRGEIDELWLFGGPWFGFNESRLAGPGGFLYNSVPYEGSSCNSLLPIMGFNYERSLSLMLESYGHRVEATMTKLYRSWAQNRTLHHWDEFGLAEALSPDFDYSGCGNIHFPPNGRHDYEYTNREPVQTICDDFFSYPNLSDPESVKKPITCDAWGCTQLSYFEYWYTHLPAMRGVNPDGRSNDWWQYIANPNLVQFPYQAMSARSSEDGSLQFSFQYLGDTSGFYIDVSTSADMAGDTFERFAEGSVNLLSEQNPQKWNGYSPGQPFFWRVTSQSGIRSQVASFLGNIEKGACTETIIAPFIGGIYAAETIGSYSGIVTIIVSGTGQAAGMRYSDAFYFYSDEEGRSIVPVYPEGWILRINGELASTLIIDKSIPAYRSDHVYTFDILAPGGRLTFGVSDLYSWDNTGSYTITVSQECSQ